MGADDKDIEPVDGGSEGIGELLQSGCAGGSNFRVREVGPDPRNGAAPEKLSAKGHATAHWGASEAAC